MDSNMLVRGILLPAMVISCENVFPLTVVVATSIKKAATFIISSVLVNFWPHLYGAWLSNGLSILFKFELKDRSLDLAKIGEPLLAGIVASASGYRGGAV